MSKVKRRIAAISIAFAAVVLVATVYAVGNMNSLVIAMAEARARQMAIEAINSAVAEVVGDDLSYNDLIDVSYDVNGHVSMLKANTPLMNDLASKAALAAQRNLSALENEGVKLPLGAAAGISLLGSSGPYIRVGVIPVGSVTTGFVTSFESAGINQTRHEISLEASTYMRIIVPTGANSVTVSSYVPVAESIIVGSVPESYVNVPDDNSMLNMIP